MRRGIRLHRVLASSDRSSRSPAGSIHDPGKIWESQLRALRESLKQGGIDLRQIRALGITNQRETTVIWDRTTGEPIYNAIVWQSRQSESICEEIRQRGWSGFFTQRTGLLVDPYFSATKIKWILDHVEGAREKTAQGQLAFGTIDSWLMHKLTGGKVHATDFSNASRTLLFNIHDLDWDEELLARLEIPVSMMPLYFPPVGSSGTPPATSPMWRFPSRGSGGISRQHCSDRPAFARERSRIPMEPAVLL